MTNPEIAAVLEQVADLLEFQGTNPFRIRAYRNAARAIRDLAESVEERLDDPGRPLTDVAGIGKDLAEKISTLVQTGSLPMLEELLAQIPESVLAILRVPGLGPKRAALLYRELGVTNLDDLREACEANRVRALKGFGPKTEATILAGLEIAAQAESQTYWARADQIAKSLAEHLQGCRAIERVEMAGSYRRRKDTVGNLDVLVVTGHNASAREVTDHLAAYPGRAQVVLREQAKMSMRLGSGIEVDLRIVPAESWGAALQHFTGSRAHNEEVGRLAESLGLRVNERGVFRGEQRVAGATEEEVYAAVNLPWFPPELREARREFDLAESGALPQLVELADLKGDLHAHTNWTDGTASIEAMAQAAKLRGLQYLAITDHSKRVAMAGGLTADGLRRQWAEIDRLNQTLDGIRLLKGVEVDILEPGGLDLDDEVLAEADWVVASVHYGQNQSSEQITRRVVGALENPNVAAIAHPTGRLLNRRKPYEIDLDAVLRAARDHGKMMELNAHPMRLDLDDIACAAAKNHGIPIVISTDSHKIDGLGALRYGVLQARRGGLTKSDVANTQPWSELKRLLA